MAHYLGRKWEKAELLSFLGDIHQIVGAKTFKYTDGKADGVSGIRVETGGGLSLTVLPGRGMDISEAYYRGNSLSYFSGTGVTSPGYYEEEGFKWLRSFFGGLLTTCGITNAGLPSEDQDQAYGLHGRVSNAGAEDVCVDQFWDGDEYYIKLKGTVREASNLGENMTLKRTIKTRLGSRAFTINDNIENHGFSAQPLMIMYHTNMGFPLLGPNAKFVGPIISTTAGNDAAQQMDDCCEVPYPQPEYEDQIFLHEMGADENGNTFMSILNRDIGDGTPLGLVMRYNKNQLPLYTEWKMAVKGGYIITMEPGTVTPDGRGALREKGALPMLKGMSSHNIDLEFEVLVGVEEFEAIEEESKKMLG